MLFSTPASLLAEVNSIEPVSETTTEVPETDVNVEETEDEAIEITEEVVDDTTDVVVETEVAEIAPRASVMSTCSVGMAIQNCFSDIHFANAIANKLATKNTAGGVTGGPFPTTSTWTVLTQQLLDSITFIDGTADLNGYIYNNGKNLPEMDNLEVFGNLTEIRNFNFSNRGLTSVGDLGKWGEAPSLQKITNINFSRNSELASLGNLGDWQNAPIVEINNINLSTMPALTSLGSISSWGNISTLKMIRTLNITDTPIESFGDLGMWGNTGLETIDALTIRNTAVESLGDLGNWGNGNTLRTLQGLVIRQNAGLTSVGNLGHWGYAENLSTLRNITISDNPLLTSIGNLSDWSGFQHLADNSMTGLDFSNNKLHNLGDTGYWGTMAYANGVGVGTLEVDFSGNELINIGEIGNWSGGSTGPFKAFKVDFSNNKLASVGEIEAWVLSNQMTSFDIDMSNNSLTNLGDLGFFVELGAVTNITLNFANNKLTSLGDISQWHRGGANLVTIDLNFANNEIERMGNIGTWAFTNLKTLKLDLSNNKLTNTGVNNVGAFASSWTGMRNLTTYHLNYSDNEELTNIGAVSYPLYYSRSTIEDYYINLNNNINIKNTSSALNYLGTYTRLKNFEVHLSNVGLTAIPGLDGMRMYGVENITIDVSNNELTRATASTLLGANSCGRNHSSNTTRVCIDNVYPGWNTSFLLVINNFSTTPVYPSTFVNESGISSAAEAKRIAIESGVANNSTSSFSSTISPFYALKTLNLNYSNNNINKLVPYRYANYSTRTTTLTDSNEFFTAMAQLPATARIDIDFSNNSLGNGITRRTAASTYTYSGDSIILSTLTNIKGPGTINFDNNNMGGLLTDNTGYNNGTRTNSAQGVITSLPTSAKVTARNQAYKFAVPQLTTRNGIKAGDTISVSVTGTTTPVTGGSITYSGTQSNSSGIVNLAVPVDKTIAEMNYSISATNNGNTASVNYTEDVKLWGAATSATDFSIDISQISTELQTAEQFLALANASTNVMYLNGTDRIQEKAPTVNTSDLNAIRTQSASATFPITRTVRLTYTESESYNNSSYWHNAGTVTVNVRIYRNIPPTITETTRVVTLALNDPTWNATTTPLENITWGDVDDETTNVAMTSENITANNVDITAEGVYFVDYLVTDSAGVTTTHRRTYVVGALGVVGNYAVYAQPFDIGISDVAAVLNDRRTQILNNSGAYTINLTTGAQDGTLATVKGLDNYQNVINEYNPTIGIAAEGTPAGSIRVRVIYDGAHPGNTHYIFANGFSIAPTDVDIIDANAQIISGSNARAYLFLTGAEDGGVHVVDYDGYSPTPGIYNIKIAANNDATAIATIQVRVLPEGAVALGSTHYIMAQDFAIRAGEVTTATLAEQVITRSSAKAYRLADDVQDGTVTVTALNGYSNTPGYYEVDVVASNDSSAAGKIKVNVIPDSATIVGTTHYIVASDFHVNQGEVDLVNMTNQVITKSQAKAYRISDGMEDGTVLISGFGGYTNAVGTYTVSLVAGNDASATGTISARVLPDGAVGIGQTHYILANSFAINVNDVTVGDLNGQIIAKANPKAYLIATGVEDGTVTVLANGGYTNSVGTYMPTLVASNDATAQGTIRASVVRGDAIVGTTHYIVANSFGISVLDINMIAMNDQIIAKSQAKAYRISDGMEDGSVVVSNRGGYTNTVGNYNITIEAVVDPTAVGTIRGVVLSHDAQILGNTHYIVATPAEIAVNEVATNDTARRMQILTITDAKAYRIADATIDGSVTVTNLGGYRAEDGTYEVTLAASNDATATGTVRITVKLPSITDAANRITYYLNEDNTVRYAEQMNPENTFVRTIFEFWPGATYTNYIETNRHVRYMHIINQDKSMVRSAYKYQYSGQVAFYQEYYSGTLWTNGNRNAHTRFHYYMHADGTLLRMAHRANITGIVREFHEYYDGTTFHNKEINIQYQHLVNTNGSFLRTAERAQGSATTIVAFVDYYNNVVFADRFTRKLMKFNLDSSNHIIDAFEYADGVVDGFGEQVAIKHYTYNPGTTYNNHLGNELTVITL